MARVLVIEDDPMSAIVFEKVLSRRGGHEVRVTEDAELVWDLAHSGWAELIVMDISLSHSVLAEQAVDGLTLTSLLKRDAATAHIPILLASAHAMRGDREEFLAVSRADEYVSKPILDHRAFCALVDRLLDQRVIPPTSTVVLG